MKESLEASGNPDELNSCKFLDQQEIRYSFGNNKALLFEILKFLRVAQNLKHRAVCLMFFQFKSNFIIVIYKRFNSNQ